MEITKNDFIAYEEVRRKGKTNMLVISEVIRLSKYVLTKEKIIEIIKNYNSYSERFK